MFTDYKDLSKRRQALDVDLKAIEQINFTENLSGHDHRLTFFITEEVKKTVLDFSQGTVKLL